MANVVLREQDWVHEWYWAWFNYHFVLVFLGPLAAGLGAWEGARLARARDLLESSGGTRRSLTAAGGAVFAWLVLPYAAGLVGISVMVRMAGTPGSPGFVEVATLGPAVTFLGAWAVIGAAGGFRGRSPMAAPLAAILSFSVILALYMVNYTLVRVGGATASLLGLASRPEIQLLQIGLYSATTVWAVARATLPVRAPMTDPARLLSLAGGGAALVLAVLLFVDSGPDFRPRAVPLRCLGQPPICLAPGYDRHPEQVRAAFTPLLARLEQIGAPLPRQMRMGGVSEDDLVGIISEDLALGNGEDPASDLITAYIRWSCRVYESEERERAWSDVYAWFQALDGSRPIRPDDPFISEVLKRGSPEAQAAHLRGAIDRLRRCA